MVTVSLNRSERCRIRNLLCKEICWLEHCKALDSDNPPEGVTRRQAKKNARAVAYDRSALAQIVPNADAAIEKYRAGRFAKLLRAIERRRKKKEIMTYKAKIFMEKLGEKAAWQVVEK